MYSVELENEFGLYHVYVQAADGEIMHLEQADASQVQEEAPVEVENEQQEQNEETEQNDQRDVLISPERAQEIALAEVADGYVDDIELEKDDGRVYYEIELETSEGEIDMEIDAYTGEIIVMSFD